MPKETPENKLLRMTTYESELWQRGLDVAGIDEVGRGPLAGPVYAACVIVPQSKLVLGVDDSKKLSEKRREALYEQLLECATYIGIGIVDEAQIDKINILEATRRAMNEAAAGARGATFLVDAMTGLTLPGDAQSIIHGDAESFMIAAASIVAKVLRDRYMQSLHAQYPVYGFARNKGYGSKEHIEALHKYGPCPAHRRTFLGKICPGITP